MVHLRGASSKLHLTASLCAALIIMMPAAAWAATVRQAQWFLDAVHAPAAQKITRGAGVVVCVVDTGVDATHPDLAGAVLPGKSFGESPKADATIDTKGHGTAMAGLIAARGGGANKALGVAPASKILPVATPTAATANWGESIKYCVDHGAKVLNISGGRPGEISKDDKDAINYALTHDVVVVIAMGNRKQTSEANGFASLPGVIAVTGTQQNNTAWPDSWTGPSAALSAPALNVSTFPKAIFSSGYSNDQGTSDSAAIVSGAAALVRAKFPNLDAANVVNRLIKSSKDLGASGRDDVYGFGLVNAEKALTMNIAQVDKNPLGEPSTTAPSSPSGPSTDNIFNTSRKTNAAPAIAGAIFLALIIGLVAWTIIKRRRRQKADPYNTYTAQPPAIAGAVYPTQASIPPAQSPTPQQYNPTPGNMPPGNVVGPQPQDPTRPPVERRQF